MRKILIVEDEPQLRTAYELILSTEPYEVDTAANGKEALELCRRKKYDLILLDLMMPVMDGLTFLKRYTADIAPADNIIILSNFSTGEELAGALELGARCNMVKASLSPKQLISSVRYELEAA